MAKAKTDEPSDHFATNDQLKKLVGAHYRTILQRLRSGDSDLVIPTTPGKKRP